MLEGVMILTNIIHPDLGLLNSGVTTPANVNEVLPGGSAADNFGSLVPYFALNTSLGFGVLQVGKSAMDGDPGYGAWDY
jgi:hypothetical protein